MKKNKLFYITTNKAWSGSEELWTRSAQKMAELGCDISVSSPFAHQAFEKLSAKKISLQSSSSFFRKIFEKMDFVDPLPTSGFVQQRLKKEKPDLVIISQGNNIDSLDVMMACQQATVPYITITQLVSEVHLLYLDNTSLPLFQTSYLSAGMNYFVSKKNLELNNRMLGLELNNAAVIYNPCKIAETDIPAFPPAKDFYSVGLVGRIECFHKGYDLLLNVLNRQKWKERNIQFNIYGDGPHTGLLRDNIKIYNLKNVHLKGYTENIAAVWRDNQMLCLPSRMEGQALALIEAMFCNRAAIVTDVGGAGELVEDGHNGFIANSASIECLDDALERAWTCRDDWEIAGVNAGKAIREKYPADSVDFFNLKILEHLEKLQA